jgi:transcription initiation factor IIE alpha subunit
MRKPFDDLLDEITEVRQHTDESLEERIEVLERIVQKLLLALVEERTEEPEDDAIVEIMPHGKPRKA